MRKIIWITLIMALGMASGCEKSGNERSSRTKIQIGSVAPDFILRDMDEKNVSLSDYKGKVVLLTFWNMKCKDCIESMGPLDEVNRMLGNKGLTIIAVNADNLEYVKPEKIVKYIKSKGHTFKVLFDETFSTSEAYTVVAIPMTYMIGRNGIISYIKYGKDDWTSKEHIESLQKLLE